MSKLCVFNFISLNGYFKGANDDISWAHARPENSFAAESLKRDSILLFGRKTYELMVQYWPTEEAKRTAPEIAEGMNNAEKIVFSRSLETVEWNNARVMKDNILEKIKTMKQETERDMTLLGSGSIATQFADARLIDELQLLVHPVALSEGTPFLNGIKKNLDLGLADLRSFESGNALLVYRRA